MLRILHKAEKFKTSNTLSEKCIAAILGMPAHLLGQARDSDLGLMERSSSQFISVIIVDAGNFSAATALSRAKKGFRVSLVDIVQYPSPRAASYDINKIVRDDYPDELYMRMMLKAMPLWRNDPLYRPWYYETGLLRSGPSSLWEDSIESYELCGINNACEILPVKEGVDKVLYNPSVGIAEAGKALKAVVQAAVDVSVEYVVSEMDVLQFRPHGEKMSVPFDTWSATDPHFIKFFEELASTTFRGLYGEEVSGVSIKTYRICWDACTPTKDFLISAHPHYKSLYVATGGSFHGWKFLPVIGEYIASLMQGTLADDYVLQWAWDKASGDGHCSNASYDIAGDLQEYL
ncbi:hypothetical protein G3M48_001144 [Beauveria asiatica]|uniref:FAD dependent oxidoreductase domain-containing protein n=1 Tax=Beauveria asiatica TaxID=1069075 RepID=A0AAW0S0S3_9HYPO